MLSVAVLAHKPYLLDVSIFVIQLTTTLVAKVYQEALYYTSVVVEDLVHESSVLKTGAASLYVLLPKQESSKAPR